MIVVDTNVIAHYFLRGAADEAVIQVMQKDPEWVAPSIWRSEARNVVMMLHVHGKEDFDGLMGRIAIAEAYMRTRTILVHSAKVLPIAKESGLTAYDAEFMSAAIELDCRLVTLDRMILSSYPKIAFNPTTWLSLLE
jgi:predicted nucleic acid-binding protein